MASLTNKMALVTGASRGIGRATASVLANAGAHVLVHYGHSAPDAESIVADIRSKGGRADAIRADLGTPDGATLLAKKVRSIVGERLDVLVSNAGISKAATIKDHTVEDFDNLFATNVRSPFFLVQQLLPILGEGSNIIVISSIGAHAVVGKPGLDNPSLLAYASTKGALETLVKNWAAILGPRGIPTFNGVKYFIDAFFPAQPDVNDPAFQGPLPSPGGFAVDGKVSEPYTHQWSADIGQQQPWGIVLDASYVHILGIHGRMTRELKPQGTKPDGTVVPPPYPGHGL